tara:strand:+ start:2723 stop:2935 length:213 start_codon:yes stop_codon:yes gene_type:complete
MALSTSMNEKLWGAGFGVNRCEEIRMSKLLRRVAKIMMSYSDGGNDSLNQVLLELIQSRRNCGEEKRMFA